MSHTTHQQDKDKMECAIKKIGNTEFHHVTGEIAANSPQHNPNHLVL